MVSMSDSNSKLQILNNIFGKYFRSLPSEFSYKSAGIVTDRHGTNDSLLLSGGATMVQNPADSLPLRINSIRARSARCHSSSQKTVASKVPDTWFIQVFREAQVKNAERAQSKSNTLEVIGELIGFLADGG